MMDEEDISCEIRKCFPEYDVKQTSEILNFGRQWKI